MTMRHFAAAVSLGLLTALAACDRPEPPTVLTTANGSRLELPAGVEPIEFAAGTVRIHTTEGATHTVRVEIAETEAQRERGLMYRTSMPEDAGMLFAYPAETEGGFWMYNTRIPLDIAFVRGERTISQMLQMQPCESEFRTLCPVYPARQPFRYALEVNQGYFAERGIAPGAHITYQRD